MEYAVKFESIKHIITSEVVNYSNILIRLFVL